MFNRPCVAATLLGTLALAPVEPAIAAGEILLTHAKALAGNVTPGDAPGYPITLSLPGVYQFAGNVHPTANAIGISIGSDDVTIDLNGFRLHGSTTALFGIAGSSKSVTISNGTITGFKFDGIYGTGDFWIVEDMRIVENGRHGVDVDDASRILNSTIAVNGDEGIRCGEGCQVEGNVVQQNGGYGISIFRGSVLGNTVTNNAEEGIISASGSAFGNNMVALNNDNMHQVFFVAPLEPNYCMPVACP